MVDSVANIAEPIDVLWTDDDRQIVIFPWFDLAGVSPKLDHLWEDYKTTRLKCCVPEGWPIHDKVDRFIAEALNEKGETEKYVIPLELVLNKAQSVGTYICGNVIEPQPNEYGRSYQYKPFAIARRALMKAIAVHFGLPKDSFAGGIHTVWYKSHLDL